MQDSHIQCEQVHTIPKTELNDYIGTIPHGTLTNVKEKLLFQFDISEDRNTALFGEIQKSVNDMERLFEATNIKTLHDSLIRAHRKLDAIRLDTDSSSNTSINAPGASNNFDTKTLEAIIKGIEALNEKADKGFGLPEIEDALLQMLIDLHSSFTKALNSTPMLPPQQESPQEDILKLNISVSAPDPSSAFNNHQDEQKTTDREVTTEASYSESKPLKQIHRKYTDDDKEFIVDSNNTIEDIIERFGFKDKPAAFSARAYMRKTYKSKTMTP